MTIQKAKENGYTHEGEMFGIPVWVKFTYEPEVQDEIFEAVGKNKFYDFLVAVLTEIDIFLCTGYAFQMWINEEKI